jgi:K+-sensing histidine kinase KdpD
LESGTDGRKRTDVDLAALVKEVADDANFEARSTNRAVQVVSSEHCSIKGIEELLRSAVENVVRNAVRYTPEGTAVEVALRRQNGGGDNYAVISVRDRGKGVPKKRSRRSFVRSIAPKTRATGRVVAAPGWAWRLPNALCACTADRSQAANAVGWRLGGGDEI